jgi:uncharacterized membrane protein
MSHTMTEALVTPPLPTRAELGIALAQVNKKLSLGLWVTHSSYGLFLVLLCWLNFQNDNSNVKILLVKLMPLLIIIPGILKKYYRTYSWLCFVILPYFVFITPTLFEAFAWGNWLKITLTVVIFIASMMTSRWLQQQSYLQWQIANTPLPKP